MSYVVTGLPVERFQPLFCLSDEALTERGVLRVTADKQPGFPCRISLEDAAAGDTLLLMHHVSHDVTTPYRSAYAIYVNESASAPAAYEGVLPPVFHGRPIALRRFDAAGLLIGADLARDEAIDLAVRRAFDETPTAYIHAHNAAYGCFAARIDRL
jgi:hypothetical protein